MVFVFRRLGNKEAQAYRGVCVLLNFNNYAYSIVEIRPSWRLHLNIKRLSSLYLISWGSAHTVTGLETVSRAHIC